jgi:hypothetical protein
MGSLRETMRTPATEDDQGDPCCCGGGHKAKQQADRAAPQAAAGRLAERSADKKPAPRQAHGGCGCGH